MKKLADKIKAHKHENTWVEPGHSKRCFTRESDSDWIWVLGEYIYAKNAKGKLKGYHTFMCNDSDCPAQLWIKPELMQDFISRIAPKDTP